MELKVIGKMMMRNLWKRKSTKMAKANFEKPTLFIPYMVWMDLDFIVQEVKNEVGGLGDIRVLPSGDFFLEEIFLFRQTVHGAECELSGEAIVETMEERDIAGKDISKMSCWWHSHDNGGVFFSGTDQDTIWNLWPGTWMVAFVTNKKQEFSAILYNKMPVPHVVELNVSIYHERANIETWKAEIAEKITEQVVVVPPFQGQYNPYWHRENGYGEYAPTERWTPNQRQNRQAWKDEFEATLLGKEEEDKASILADEEEDLYRRNSEVSLWGPMAEEELIITEEELQDIFEQCAFKQYCSHYCLQGQTSLCPMKEFI
jgi:hypothetical protein